MKIQITSRLCHFHHAIDWFTLRASKSKDLPFENQSVWGLKDWFTLRASKSKDLPFENQSVWGIRYWFHCLGKFLINKVVSPPPQISGIGQLLEIFKSRGWARFSIIFITSNPHNLSVCASFLHKDLKCF